MFDYLGVLKLPNKEGMISDGEKDRKIRGVFLALAISCAILYSNFRYKPI